jgi:hypothetical protein
MRGIEPRRPTLGPSASPQRPMGNPESLSPCGRGRGPTRSVGRVRGPPARSSTPTLGQETGAHEGDRTLLHPLDRRRHSQSATCALLVGLLGFEPRPGRLRAGNAAVTPQTPCWSALGESNPGHSLIGRGSLPLDEGPSWWWVADGVEPLAHEGRRLQRREGTALPYGRDPLNGAAARDRTSVPIVPGSCPATERRRRGWWRAENSNLKPAGGARPV